MKEQKIVNNKIILMNGGIVKLNYYKLQGRELIEKIYTIIATNNLNENQKEEIDELMLKILVVLGIDIVPEIKKNSSNYISNAKWVIDIILDFITREELPEIEEKRLDRLMERITNLIDLELHISEINYSEIYTSAKV